MKRKWITYGLCMALALLTSSLEGSDELFKKKLTSSYHNFEVINKLIVVQATLGGVSGNYIFDTGATGLILNAAHHKSVHPKCSEILGANASTKQVFKIDIKSFRFGTIEKRNFKALCLDLDHIEASLDKRIDGLIGLDVIADAVVSIDYDAQLMMLSDPSQKYISPDYQFDLQMVAGIAAVKAQLQNQELILAIDFGATTSILDKEAIAGMDLPVIEKIDLLTAGGTSSALDKVTCNQLKIGKNLELNTQAVVHDLSHLQSEGIDIDGIIGLDLFNAGRIVIDPNKGTLSIWKN